MDSGLNLPPGFRFHPTDEELVRDYLVRRCAGLPIAAPVVAEVDLYRFDPWCLPEMASYGEKDWYFFSPRDRKYPNGMRPNRSAGTGYWKATGADKPIGHPKTLGIKKALVFYAGRSPQGVKTNWIMHEYRLANVDRSTAGKKNKLRLDDWVLCRIYNKKGYIEKYTATEDNMTESTPAIEQQRRHQQPLTNWAVNVDTQMMKESKTTPKLQPESSGSDLVNSPEVTSNKEIQSGSKWDDFAEELENGFDFSMADLLSNDLFGFQTQLQMNQVVPQQDAFLFPQQNHQSTYI